VDYVRVERSEIEETGTFDWKDYSSGLATPLTPSMPSAWCWTLSSLSSAACQRSDPARRAAPALRLLKTKGVTAVITAERGSGTLTRQAWRNTSPTASSCWITASTTRFHAPAAHREVSRLAARHQRIPFLIGAKA